jgi:ferredoxin
LFGKITPVPNTSTASIIFQAQLDSQAPPFAASADQTVLLSALAAGHALLSSCRNGVCRTCICRLQSGRVSYRMEWPGLSAEEKAEGWFLPCVAYPAADLVIAK